MVSKIRMDQGLCEVCSEKHCGHDEIIKAVFIIGYWEVEKPIKLCQKHLDIYHDPKQSDSIAGFIQVSPVRLISPFEHKDVDTTEFKVETDK